MLRMMVSYGEHTSMRLSAPSSQQACKVGYATMDNTGWAGRAKLSASGQWLLNDNKASPHSYIRDPRGSRARSNGIVYYLTEQSQD